MQVSMAMADGFPVGNVSNKERAFFITEEMARDVLEACPSLEWKVIFALARYGGLRCPSELRELRWGDILWDKKRFVVRCVKVEHHEGHATRIVPLFSELEPLLQEAFDAAPDGSEFVIRRAAVGATNLRTQMARIVERAGITPWPKIFHNLRSTRQTELAEVFPISVVCKWIGNSPGVADASYLQVTDDHFDRATAQDFTAAVTVVSSSNG